jgi:L-ribulokinase
MLRDKFVIGVDFGTESGRVVVVRVRDGEEMAAAVIPYPDGVLDEKLPGGPRLEPDSALQNPHDYYLVLEKAIPRAVKEAGVKPEDVIAIGTDFTSCTVFATQRDGTPLCFLPKYRREPLAWPILWKHHAAQPEADRITEIGRERNEEFIRMYSNKYSSDGFFAKVLQVLNDSPEIYRPLADLLRARTGSCGNLRAKRNGTVPRQVTRPCG